MSLFDSKANLVVVLGVGLMVCLLGIRWLASGHVEKRQEALIAAIEDGSWGKCEKLISENYADRWGWNRNDLGMVFKDVRSQFLVLSITLEDPDWDITNDRAEVKGRIRLRGRSFGAGAYIEREVNRENEHMSFTWQKESWLPGSWKLVRMHHGELEIPDSYEPGDLLRARQNW